ncbi:MAG: hypothetical protein ACK55O_14665 [Phycisphaerales bacterium]|jgi:hypothetical protein
MKTANNIGHLGFLVAAVFSLSLGACATKNHGRLSPVSSLEKTELTCREIDIEISKVHAFLDQVSSNSEVDGRSVLGFLGDFGIGNAMERSAAESSARKRLEELNTLRVARGCGPAATAPATAK